MSGPSKGGKSGQIRRVYVGSTKAVEVIHCSRDIKLQGSQAEISLRILLMYFGLCRASARSTPGS